MVPEPTWYTLLENSECRLGVKSEKDEQTVSSVIAAFTIPHHCACVEIIIVLNKSLLKD